MAKNRQNKTKPFRKSLTRPSSAQEDQADRTAQDRLPFFTNPHKSLVHARPKEVSKEGRNNEPDGALRHNPFPYNSLTGS